MIIVCQTLLKNTKISGITLFPFILLREKALKNNPTLINHEKIHWRQQLELGIIPFYIWYVFEFCYWFIKYRNKYIAYRKICFEREAFAQERSLNYLEKRGFWAFLKYLA